MSLICLMFSLLNAHAPEAPYVLLYTAVVSRPSMGFDDISCMDAAMPRSHDVSTARPSASCASERRLNAPIFRNSALGSIGFTVYDFGSTFRRRAETSIPANHQAHMRSYRSADPM